MRDVVVVGAGKRVVGAVLPALWCLRDRYRITDVVARTIKPLTVAGQLAITTTDSFDRVELERTDLVVVAVTTAQVPRVLEVLARRAPHAVLMLDTPVLPLTALRATRALAAFDRVLVSEDNLGLPPFVLARKLIDAGEIGAVRRIFFFHNGYKYHALASIKLLGGGAIRRIVNRKYAGKLRHKHIELDNGVTAVMYEPRDYAIGKFLVEGERGAIADYDYAVAPVRRIGYVQDGPLYRGLTLDGETVAATDLDQRYLAGIGRDVHEGSLMNTMKIRGLIELLAAAFEPRSPLHYAPLDGIRDNLYIRLVDRIGYLPAGLLGRALELVV